MLNWCHEVLIECKPPLCSNFLYCFILQRYYLATARELTRLDSITKAPVIHHFSESIQGVMTIRSFRKQGQFCVENIRRVNNNLRMDFHNNGSNEWLGFRLEFFGSIVFCCSALFLILLPSSIVKPGKWTVLMEKYVMFLKHFSECCLIVITYCRKCWFDSVIWIVFECCLVLGHIYELLHWKQNGVSWEGEAIFYHTTRSCMEN